MRHPRSAAGLTLILLSALAVGCADDTGALSATPLDPAEPRNWDFYCEPEPGRVVAPGMSYGDGCNQCSCPSAAGATACSDGVCTGGGCTAAGCFDPIPGVPDGYPACTSNADCGPNGACIFDAGCAAPSGTCVQVQINPNLSGAEAYCTCDGRTVNAATPLEPYAHAGPCM